MPTKCSFHSWHCLGSSPRRLNGSQEFEAREDKQAVPAAQQAALAHVTDIEEALVTSFPFDVPPKYAALPQLKGRAVLEMKIKLATPRQDGVTGGILTMVADGYNAPVTAGNFVDLAARRFYDGMEFQRADGFVVQTGDPGNAEAGYVEGGKARTLPFEVRVQNDQAPIYEETLEDLGRFNEQPALPFNAYGTIAAARSEFEANSASSQIFWLLKESELTPSGANLLDGRYAVLGYVVDGAELLADVQVGDKIEYIKIVSGGDLLQKGKGAAVEAVAPVAAAEFPTQPSTRAMTRWPMRGIKSRKLAVVERNRICARAGHLARHDRRTGRVEGGGNR